MPKLFLAIVLAFAGTSALAGWTLADGDNVSTDYYDPATIVRSGVFATMWSLSDLKTAHRQNDRSILSTKVHAEYDCTENKMRILLVVDFAGPMGRGRSVGFNNDPGPWLPVAAGSGFSKYVAAACQAAPSGSTDTARHWDYGMVNAGLKGEQDTIYLDLSATAKGVGAETVKTWNLFSFVNPQRQAAFPQIFYRSYTVQYEFDCKSTRSRQLSIAWYAEDMAKGDVVLASDDAGDWEPMPPRGLLIQNRELACNRQAR